jgi:hypothetical protein
MAAALCSDWTVFPQTTMQNNAMVICPGGGVQGAVGREAGSRAFSHLRDRVFPR